jgi:ribonuclease Z
MELSHMHRVVAALLTLLFAALGVTFWVVPEQAAYRLGLEAVGVTGLSALRADVGGLFVGLALLCAAAAWTRRRSWLFAATLVLGAIVLGRSFGWAVEGRVGILELAVELAVLGLLAVCIYGSRPAATGERPSARRGRWIVRALPILAAACALVALLNPTVEQWLFDGAAERLVATVNAAPLADDAIRVAVCGSSAPLPSAGRAKACVAVFAGGKFYLVDVGPESVENLVTWGVPLASIGGVLLTHFHSDHIGDLGELNLQTWAGGRPEPLRVYGGPGVDQVVAGFNHAYRLDQGYRTAHHGEGVMRAAAWPMTAHPVELDGPPTPEKSRTGTVLDDGALRITAIEVDHAPIAPAYAYRFDYNGRSVVVTGDLKFHSPLAKAAADADILVSEAIATSMTRALGRSALGAGRDRTAAIMHDIEDYHITPEEAARIANEARVKLLVFYHLLPAPDGFLTRRLFSQGVNAVRRGDWTIADDGSLYTLPIGSTEVRIGRVGG